jgi:hypothetical protein
VVVARPLLINSVRRLISDLHRCNRRRFRAHLKFIIY